MSYAIGFGVFFALVATHALPPAFSWEWFFAIVAIALLSAAADEIIPKNGETK